MCIGEKIVGDWIAWDLIQEFLRAQGDTDERAVIIQQKLREMESRLGWGCEGIGFWIAEALQMVDEPAAAVAD